MFSEKISYFVLDVVAILNFLSYYISRVGGKRDKKMNVKRFLISSEGETCQSNTYFGSCGRAEGR